MDAACFDALSDMQEVKPPCLFNDCFFHADYEVRAARLLEQIILDWNRLGQDLEDLGF